MYEGKKAISQDNDGAESMAEVAKPKPEHPLFS